MSNSRKEIKPKSKRGRPRKIKHGAYSLITRGELPASRRYLEPYLTGVREGLIQDLGPKEIDLTTAQKVIVDRIVTYLGIVRLIEEYVKDKGIFQNPQGFLNPALSTSYLAYCGHIQRALQALGITTRQIGEPMDLGRYVEQQDRAKAEKAAASDKGDGKIAVPRANGEGVLRQDKGITLQAEDPGQGNGEERAGKDALRATSSDLGHK
jgi:hypothetical protein